MNMTDPDTTSLAAARRAIDEVDAELAGLLERRAALAAAIQRLKPVGGFAGRNPERERQIVETMAERAPLLGPDRLARIMNTVIEAGLEVAEAAAHEHGRLTEAGLEVAEERRRGL